MKNHIKDYIKIMGLAAVPFGTAQAEDYEISVTSKMWLAFQRFAF